MIGASKILTVSYGTFSCTLEGFDDSFGTMKAIAEYFRDLAADDRYFGAEPPTPDAEMLAKIAGREIKRQVEAKIDDNGVVLRPLGHTATADVQEDVATVAPEPAPQPAPVAAPVVEVAPVVAPHVVETVVVEDVHEALVIPATEYDDAQDEAQVDYVAEEPKTEGDTESVAAKLRRIRAVVDKNQTAGAAASIFSEDQQTQDYTPEATEDEHEEDLGAEDDTDLSAMMSRISDDVADEEDDQQEAVAEAEEVSDEYEDETSVETVASIEEEIALVEDVVSDEAEMADDNLTTEEVAEADIEESDTDLEAAEDKAADEDHVQDTVRPIRPTRARVIKMKKAELQEVVSTGALAGMLNDNTEDQGEADAQDDVQDILGETSLSAEDEADLVAELADVEQADAEFADAEHIGAILEDDDILEDDGEQDDAELDDGIEQDETEEPEEATEVSLEDIRDIDLGIETALRSERANRALHDEGGAEDEASVSRLLDETNAKLDATESTRRRSAISHLRAAVAATVADHKLNPLRRKQPDDDSEQYRADLADVVQPARPETDGDSQTDRPAPLILVSEQRIDEDEPAEQEPTATIIPRRVSKATVALREVEKDTSHNLDDLSASNDGDSDSDGANIFADSTSFTDFAEKMGATELPDLLEAAAAYTAYVEGRPHFARPQIMRQVASFAGKREFNREEGLRSFGQLLRQGKIIKVKRGQFEIADSTRFKPEARYAGE